MIKCPHRPIGLFLALALIAGLVPEVARANDGGTAKFTKLHVTDGFSPIGTVYSLGKIFINGRASDGEQILLGGENVSPVEASAAADLPGVGRVVFCRGSSARLLTSLTADPLNGPDAVLTAVVTAGSVVISLGPDSVACVEIGEIIIRSSRGSRFTVGIVGGETLVEVERGEITKELQQPRVRYIVKSAKLNLLGIPVGPGPDTHHVRTDHFVTIPVLLRPQPANRPPRQPEGLPLRVAYQAAPASQPPLDVEVEFCLTTDPTIGSFERTGGRCTTERTDQYGVAKTRFQAGGKKGTSKIRATVLLSSEDYWEGVIEVYKVGFWRLRNTLILAAAAVGGTVCIFKCRPNKPLHQVPPPMTP